MNISIIYLSMKAGGLVLLIVFFTLIKKSKLESQQECQDPLTDGENRELLSVINEFKSNSDTLDVDDKEMVNLIYEEIDARLTRGIISKEVANKLKSLPINKLLIVYDEVQKKLLEFSKDNN